MIDADRIRIAVAIARSGAASRRAAEELVQQRRVTVDGQVVTDLSLRVHPTNQQITLDGRPLAKPEPLRYYALNKPRGVLSTVRDDRGRHTVVEFLPGDAPRCVPVGRLDLDSEGLLLLTNDGPLIDRLLHPSQEVQRVYLAEVVGQPSDRALDRIFEGIRDQDELLQAKPARSRRPGRSLSQPPYHLMADSDAAHRAKTRGAALVRRHRPSGRHSAPGALWPAAASRLANRQDPSTLSRREIRLLQRAAGLASDTDDC